MHSPCRGFAGELPGNPVEAFRDVKLTTIGEGTSEIQRMAIARHLVRAAVERTGVAPSANVRYTP